MPWGALLHTAGRGGTATYRNLVLRIEDGSEPRWLVRLYDGDTAIGEATADSPREAIETMVDVAKWYLNDQSITIESFDWVQLSK